MRRNIRLCILAAATQALLFGQLDSGTVTVTATRTSNLQADQVLLWVAVEGPGGADLNDVLGALAGSGVTASDLSSVTTSQFLAVQQGQTMQWSFNLALPFARLGDTLTALTRAQRSASQKGMDVNFATQGTRVSAELAASQPCALTALVSDARSLAEKLAAAAGATVGPIVAVRDMPEDTERAVLPANPAGLASFLLGVRASLYSVGSPGQNCTMTVQFRLVR